MSPHQLPLFGSIPLVIFFTINGVQPATLANTNANGNYSGGAVTRFQIIPAANERWLIYTVDIFLECAGNIGEDGYGQSATPLTVGINLQLTDALNVQIFNYNGGLPVLKNVDWYKYGTQSKIHATNNLPILNIEITQPQPIYLDGSLGHRLSFLLNDNFTGRNIITQQFIANGIKLRTFEAKGESAYNGY